METRAPKVGVVTVTYNSETVLPDFLDSLAQQVGVELRLYAVDNDSHDASVAMLRAESRLGFVAIVPNDSNVGVAVGNNQGIELALQDGCDWVLLLNNDTVLPGNALATLVQVAEENGLKLLSPAIEATEPAGTIWYGGGKFVPLQGFRTLHGTAGQSVSQFPKELVKTGYASTCCLLVHPAVFKSVGLMDPVYFVYFDDVDFAVRSVAQGFEYWVTPEVTIIHKASSLTGGKSSPFTVKWVSRNWPLIAIRHLNVASKFVALSYIQVWMFARLALRRDSVNVFRVRQSGFREALRVASAVPPPRLSYEATNGQTSGSRLGEGDVRDGSAAEA
ncbi:glycosyltransferase family 2 protein [Cryobacterium arcticum]|uniref:Glycosyltransferase 2-like domain-containing protein n=1 Tax=Cryobacterium arcticum TaxID=670052 RepID=A0A1B1BN34_9MICO|nr:glycosyltransferase family 2 protein [Cryobacterium arcticum]ANP73906.1 hypothetical protein PA27867_2969 [Cryobacterium arcticum]